MRRSLALATSAAMVLAVVLAGGPAYAGRTSGLRFHAASQTWVSPEHGLMLGSGSCGLATCTTVAGTVDGGLTWNRLGALDAPVTLEQETGVTGLRFDDDLNGWAFGPALWATTDGGVTWLKQVPPGGRPVVALAGDADAVYAVVSACSFGQATSDCRNRTTLWRTAPGQGSWTQVSLKLPVANQAVLAVHGLVAYLVIPTPGSTDPDVLYVTVDGQRWSSRPDPCSKIDGEYLSSVAPVSNTNVALLCQGDIGFGKAEKRVLRSNDTGQTVSSAGTLSIWGITSQLAAAPNGTLLVSSFSIGGWIYRNAGGQTWTTSEDLGDGGIGWNDILFTTNQVGFVIHGPAFCCGGQGPGELWKTEDAGITWRQTEVAPRP